MAADATPRSTSLVTASAVIAWLAIVGVLLRIVSGGGTIIGVGYVLETEPRVVIAVGGVVLLIAAIAVLGLVLGTRWAWRASSIGAGLALLAGLLLLAGGHDSASLVVVAAIVILGLGWRSARGADAGTSPG